MIDELMRAIIWTVVPMLVSGMVAVASVVFWLWIDVRSLKKSARSAFIKIRKLEESVHGKVTSELDGR